MFQDTLENCIHMMATRKVHRVWVVDGADRPLKCISQRDILYNIMHKPVIIEA